MSDLISKRKSTDLSGPETASSIKRLQLEKTAMSPALFDWSKIIADLTDETFGIPPDVAFQIVENDQVHEIKAHKTIFAMISPFFKTMFYSMVTGDKTAKVFKIEKTTAAAFQIMKEAIYNNKSIEDSLHGKSVEEVFHVVELIERFQIKELSEAMKEYMTSYPVTDDSVMEVAQEAMEYSGLFEAQSEHLQITCAKFLMPKLKEVKDTMRYTKENKDRKEVFASLMALMDDIVPNKCQNCKKEVCQDGLAVPVDELKEGLVVTNNKAYSGWGKKDYGTGKITKVESYVFLKSIKPGISQNGLTASQFSSYGYTKVYPYFSFSCK